MKKLIFRQIEKQLEVNHNDIDIIHQTSGVQKQSRSRFNENNIGNFLEKEIEALDNIEVIEFSIDIEDEDDINTVDEYLNNFLDNRNRVEHIERELEELKNNLKGIKKSY